MAGLLTAVLLSGSAWAHGGAHDTVTLTLLEDGVRIRATPPATLLEGLDGGDGVFSVAELTAHEDVIVQRVLARTRVVDDLGLTGEARTVEVALRDRGHGHGAQVSVHLLLAWPAAVSGLSLTTTGITAPMDLHVRVGQDIESRTLGPRDAGVPLRLRGAGPAVAPASESAAGPG